LKTPSKWSIYLIRCADHSLYVGITTDVDRRFREHCTQGKQSAKYLRGRGPLELVFREEVGTKSQASRLEYCLKQLTKLKKESLVIGKMSLVDLAGWN
jgi:putative endonuclease